MPLMECRCGMLISVASAESVTRCIRCGNTHLNRLEFSKIVCVSMRMYVGAGSGLRHVRQMDALAVEGTILLFIAKSAIPKSASGRGVALQSLGLAR
jgi:hypothetical protein